MAGLQPDGAPRYRRVRELAPELSLVLGGISPIDPTFITLLGRQGALDCLDAVAVHGFPLDWNHWQINEWPSKIAEIRAVTGLPVWVTEVGVSTFGADEVQVFGIQRTSDLLLPIVENVFWYSLLDLPPTWEATTAPQGERRQQLLSPLLHGPHTRRRYTQTTAEYFNPQMGICQWFHYDDPRLQFAVEWLRELHVKKLRTGISWADWHRPNAVEWFDRQMAALEEFDTTVTFCFTPPSRGKWEHHTSPPVNNAEFSYFAEQVVRRYVRNER